ncbi:unnamed protein product [Paramecium sonneborni]|uniref:Uncharacterized protein n=1 Tax=Paramecium sonneborni TaxID=65129 RepID=A0A8S1Q5H5_9CILI|nr:unnamed protein product [Paramecium sonneborni]
MTKSENEDYSMFFSSYDSALYCNTNVQEMKKVNKQISYSIYCLKIIMELSHLDTLSNSLQKFTAILHKKQCEIILTNI